MGHLPPSVYWRRRVIVLLGIAVLIALIAFACTAGGGDDKENAANASSVSPSSSPSVPSSIGPGPAADTTGGIQPPPPGTAGGAGVPGQPGGAVPGGDPAGGTAAGGTAAGGTAAGGNGPAPAGGGTAGGTSNGAGGGQNPGCELRVQLQGDRASDARYVYGEQVNLRLIITNTGKDTCTVDLGRSHTAVDVRSGSDRIYSSADCVAPSSEPNQIQPGKSVTREFSWTWKRTSPSMCTGPAPTLVPPTHNSTYIAVGRVGDVHSGEYRMISK